MTGRERKNILIKTAMRLSAEKGWAGFTFKDIADETGIYIALIRDFFEDKTDILTGFSRMIDQEILAHPRPDTQTPARERLFEVLMARFDALGPYKAGVLSALENLSHEPHNAVIGLPHIARSMHWMMGAANIDTHGLKGTIRLTAITGLYLRALCIWRKDDTPDLAKTMAALDRYIQSIDRLLDGF